MCRVLEVRCGLLTGKGRGGVQLKCVLPFSSFQPPSQLDTLPSWSCFFLVSQIFFEFRGFLS